MLIRFFRGSGPEQVILIFLTALCVWLNAFINPIISVTFHYDVNPMPLYGLLKQVIGENALFGVIFSFLLILLMSFLVVNFNTRSFFISERTFLPAVIYVLLTGLFPDYQLLNPVLPASVFLLLAIRRIMDSYKLPGTAYNLFDASLLIGIGVLFYANLIWFAFLVFVGIAIMRTGNLKELFISFIGLITPGLLTVGIYYVADGDISSLPDILYSNLFAETEKFNFSTIVTIGLLLVGLIIIISTLDLLSRLNNKKIKARKTFSELIWSLVISFAVYFIIPTASVELLWLAGIPVCYIVAHYFIFSKNKLVTGICFAGLFIIVVFMQVQNLR
jgi:hypothetical protein